MLLGESAERDLPKEKKKIRHGISSFHKFVYDVNYNQIT